MDSIKYGRSIFDIEVFKLSLANHFLTRDMYFTNFSHSLSESDSDTIRYDNNIFDCPLGKFIHFGLIDAAYITNHQ